jgi:hypothetical protein
METPNAINQMFSYFAVVHDPRRQHPTTLHPLEAIITITILATICGAHNWVEIEQWGQGDRILSPCNDVDWQLESDLITGS